MEEKRPNQCVVDGCERTRYVGYDKCVLHCEKNGNTQIKYELFAKELKDYATAQANKTLEEKSLTFAKNKPKIFIFDKIIFPQFFQFSDIYFNQNIDRSSSIIMNECVFFSNVSIEQNFIEFFVCTFNEDVSLTDIKLPKDSYTFFQHCLFHRSFCFSEVSGLGSLEFRTCEFKEYFLINKSELINFEMIFLIFNSNVSIINSTIGKMEAPIIEFVSFKENTDFSNTKFPCGLILEHSFFNSNVNFNNVSLDSEKSLKVTPIESFRQIKHSLDNISNTIEANKYFALEMDKLYSELTWNNNFSEKLLLSINKYTSNFGQNWWLPVFLIFIFASLFLYIKSAYCNGYLSFLDSNSFLSFLNELSGSIQPLSNFLKKGLEFLSLFFGIIFTVLIYQAIIALKRRTRR